MEDRQKQIIKASWVSIIGNAILASFKIFIGLLAGSLAVVGDGIDSTGDIIISIITLLTAHVIIKPPNIRYPYGYSRADTIASKVLSFVIFFAGAQLAISTVNRLTGGISREIPNIFAIYVTVFSIIGKLLLAYYQMKIGRKTHSTMLIANAKNMQSDVVISISVLIGLFFTFTMKMPVIDSVAALLVSLWIMYTAIKIFLESNMELMDGIDNPEIYSRIFDAIAKVEGVSDPHNVRVRKLGHQYMITMDIEIDGNISLKEAHIIAHKVDHQIRADIENVYDIQVHMEPMGDEIKDNKYGVSREELKEKR